MKDCYGTILPCYSLDLNPIPTCSNTNLTYTYDPNGSFFWTNWQVHSIDLSALIGSCVTIEAITKDCAYGGHLGTTLFDARCGSASLPSWCNACTTFTPMNTVNYCPGSGQALINGPAGYISFTWTAPGNGTMTSTGSSLTIINPVLSSVYMLQATNENGCTSTFYYTIVTTSVGISAIESSPSCSLGSVGSATVQATGSGTGYLYTWLNSSYSVVSTSSVAVNLSMGVYSVIVTANPASGCGTAIATVTVGLKLPTVKHVYTTFCGNTAYLSALPGTNHQWYAGINLIPASAGGTASMLVVPNASAYSVYHVTFFDQGCLDSLEITLLNIGPGSISILNNSFICEGQSNGIATVSITPSFNAPTGLNSFTVISSNTLTPNYSYIIGPTSSNTLNLSSLSSFGNYSVTVFDGACVYSLGFTKSTLPNTPFTLNPASSVTLCPGNILSAGVTLTNSLYSPLYSYSWTPTTFLANSNGTLQQTVITPTFAPGIISSIIYSIVVTPTTINCPVTQTMSVTMISPLAPTIGTIPMLCTNSSPYTISVNPGAGIFSGNAFINPSTGIFNPFYTPLGTSTFSYAVSIGTCVAQSSASFVVNTPPPLTVFGNTLICLGQSTSLQALGPATINWLSISSGSMITVSPSVTTIYTVTEFDPFTSCSTTRTLMLHVAPNPVVSISGTNQVCSGNTVQLTANGAQSYYWNTSASGSVIVVNPVNSGFYNVIGTSAIGYCTNTASIYITVYPSPNLSISPQTSICVGDNIILTASGANVYNWVNGPTSASMSITPAISANYTVTGINNLGNCSSTQTIAISVSECTGIEKWDAHLNGVTIFPNPTKGIVSIETQSKILLSVFDASGKLIFEKHLEKGIHTLDLSQYSSGVYLLKVSDSSSMKIIKLVKTD